MHWRATQGQLVSCPLIFCHGDWSIQGLNHLNSTCPAQCCSFFLFAGVSLSCSPFDPSGPPVGKKNISSNIFYLKKQKLSIQSQALDPRAECLCPLGLNYVSDYFYFRDLQGVCSRCREQLPAFYDPHFQTSAPAQKFFFFPVFVFFS